MGGSKGFATSGSTGLSLTNPGHCLSGGILQSCRSSDSRGAWPLEAPSSDGDALSLSLLHRCELLAAPLHARRAIRRRQASPHCLGGGREVLVLPLTSWIGTGDVSQAYPVEISPLCQPRLIQPMTGCHLLRLSPWEQVFRSERQEPP